MPSRPILQAYRNTAAPSASMCSLRAKLKCSSKSRIARNVELSIIDVVVDERVLSAATNRARGDWAVIRLSKRFILFTFIVNRFWIKELSAKTECRLRDFDISN